MRGKRRSRQDYEALIKRFGRSGLSLYAFARKEGVPYSTLSQWKRRLAGTARKTKAPEPPPQFLPVMVTGPTPAEARIGEGCEVRLRSGHELRVPPGFDAATLIALISALESSACSR